MTIINDAPKGLTIMTSQLTAALPGARSVFDQTSCIEVRAFPFASIPQLSGFLDTAAAYLLVGNRQVYCGETNKAERRLAEHFADPTKSFATDVYMVCLAQGRFDKSTVVELQSLLTNGIEAAGLVRVEKGTGACQSDLSGWRAVNVAHLYDLARPLLYVAGFRGLDAAQPLPGAANDDDAADHDDADDNGEMEVGVTVTPPGVEEAELVHPTIWARGYHHLGRFIAVAGSEARVAENPSVSEHTRKRRKQLVDANALEEIPGVSDRRRLRVAVAFPSMAIAGKVLTGTHIGTEKWRPLGRTPIVVAV